MKYIPLNIFVVLCSICLLLVSSVLDAKTVYVDQSTGSDSKDGLSWTTAKKTVISALNIAVSGDQVWVSQGVYMERITLKSGIALYGGFPAGGGDWDSRDFTANVTVLDGSQGGCVVTVPLGASNITRIDGFTIRNGKASLNGGGVFCAASSSPVISNNIITANKAAEGGGIYCTTYSSAIISSNVITSNTATAKGGGISTYGSPSITLNTISINSANSAQGVGGGIYCSSGSAAVNNNTISGNSANIGGGGIYANSASPSITGNTISSNSTGSYGGGIYCINGSASICNNVISDNIQTGVGGKGGGIGCSGNFTGSIINNIVKYNRADGINGFGGGISCYSSAKVIGNIISGNIAKGNGGGILCAGSNVVVNNTIVSNSANDGGAVYCSDAAPTIINNIVAFNTSGINNFGIGTPLLRANNIYSNNALNYAGLIAGDGDISVDPQFIDRTNDNYHLKLTSPCIDSGWGDAPNIPETDIDGQLRVQGRGIDIGADECMPEAPATGIVRSVGNGRLVALSDMVVTAIFTDYFYVEDILRVFGMRVDEASHGLIIGKRVDVTGSVDTNSHGERYVLADLVTERGTGSVCPIALALSALGGGNWQYDSDTGAGQMGVIGGTGLNNIGLLVRVCGAFHYVNDHEFTVSDGNASVKCVVPANVTLNQSWQCVGVTGISSCEKVTGGLGRLVLVRNQSDIVSF